MSDPIRVLCVFSTLDRGGAESMCMNLYRHIDREKVQFDFVKHTNAKCAFDEEIISLGGKIYIAPRFKGYNLIPYQSWWRNHLAQHPEHRIIHGHYFTASKYYFAVCKKMNRITIGHSHTDTYSDKDIAKRIMIRNVENYCDYRLACSEKAGKLLYPHKDFMVLKNAIDTDLYRFDPAIRSEVREEYNLRDSFTLGTVGTIKEVKNPLGIVEIFSEVSKMKPDTKLLWVGRDEGMQGTAEARLKELGLADHVIFTGTRSDVYRLMQAMDIFILPSFSEGIPVVMIEAQAAGLPCFASEAVSKDTDITGLCRYLPLEEWAVWSKEITAYCEERKDTSQAIKAAGFDIHDTASWIQEFYLNIMKSN